MLEPDSSTPSPGAPEIRTEAQRLTAATAELGAAVSFSSRPRGTACDACAATGTYWVFLSPGSNVEYDVTVRDVVTGEQKTYSNPLGSFPRLTADAQTFPCS